MVMKSVTVSQGNGPPDMRTNTWAKGEMLMHAVPVQVLNVFGDSQPLPKNKGKHITLRRWDVKTIANNSGVATADGMPVPLVEGVQPTATDFTYTDVSAELEQFGDYTEITDQCEDFFEDPVRQNATEQNGEQAGEIVELACWGVVRAGTNVDYADGVAGRTTVDNVVSKVQLQRIERTLMANKAKHIRKVQTGSVNYETRPIKASYIIIGHTDLLADFEAIEGWIPYQKYASQDRVCEYEEGSIGKFRIILSPTLTKWADAATGALASTHDVVSTSGTLPDVYPFVAFGEHAYGHVRLRGKNAISAMIVQPDQPSAGDRLGQVGSVGWKTYYVSLIQNNDWLIRGEVAVSDLAA